MPEELERIANLESRMLTAEDSPGGLKDHEARIRKIERAVYGLLISGAILGWGLTQINNIVKIIGAV